MDSKLTSVLKVDVYKSLMHFSNKLHDAFSFYDPLPYCIANNITQSTKQIRTFILYCTSRELQRMCTDERYFYVRIFNRTMENRIFEISIAKYYASLLNFFFVSIVLYFPIVSYIFIM